MKALLFLYILIIPSISIAEEIGLPKEYEFKSDGIFQCSLNPFCYYQIKIEKANGIEASDIFSAFALIISLFSIGQNSYQDRNRRRQSVEDEFWLRQVIYPQCIEPLIDLVRNSPDKYLSYGSDNMNFFDNYYLEKANQARDSLLVIRAHSEKLYDELSEMLDSLDDEICKIKSHEELRQCVSAFLNCAIIKFKKYQNCN